MNENLNPEMIIELMSKPEFGITVGIITLGVIGISKELKKIDLSLGDLIKLSGNK